MSRTLYLFRESGGTISSNWFGLMEKGHLGTVQSLNATARDIVQKVRNGDSIIFEGYSIENDAGVYAPYKYRLLTLDEVISMRQAVAKFDQNIASQVFGPAPAADRSL